MNPLVIRSLPCAVPVLMKPGSGSLAPAKAPLSLAGTTPKRQDYLPVATDGGLRIVVITGGLPEPTILPAFQDWLERFRSELPAGSKIEVLCGRASEATTGVHSGGRRTMDHRETELWLARFRPDLVYYPRLGDLAFGVHPVMWNQSPRLDLPRIWINSCTPPSSVRERLLIREMMIADGPGVHAAEAVTRRPSTDRNRGMRWLIHGPDDAREISLLRPTFAATPRFGLLGDTPGETHPFGPAAALAGYLLGAMPLEIPPLVIHPVAAAASPLAPLPVAMLPTI